MAFVFTGDLVCANCTLLHGGEIAARKRDVSSFFSVLTFSFRPCDELGECEFGLVVVMSNVKKLQRARGMVSDDNTSRWCTD